MEKLTKYVIQYLKYSSPVVVIAVGMSLAGYAESGALWTVVGVISVIWFLSLWYLFFALTFQLKFRDNFYRKIFSYRNFILGI